MLSETARQIRRSVMRDLMSVAVDPALYSFAGGLPASDCLPVDTLRDCMERVLQKDGTRALQYGPPYAPLKAWIASWMQQRGVDCTSDSIFITNGAQQGLAVLSRLFCDAGDPAVIEAVTFTGIQQVTVGRRLQVSTVPADLQTGVDVQALEHRLKAQPKPHMVVLIPDFHNPLGVSLPEEKRRHIAWLAAKYRVPVIEDDPYSPLRFAGEGVKPIRAFDESGFVVYIGSFSKMLAPAVRLGWIVAPPDLGHRITVLREALDLESSQFMQRVVFEFLDGGHLETHLERLRRTNARRCRRLLDALETYLSPFGARWTLPQGGLFVWVEFPEDIDTRELFHVAIDHQVAYIPGAAFAVSGDQARSLRLNYSNIADDRIEEGIKRLARSVEVWRTQTARNP